MYFVYTWTDPVTGSIFYVGKGKKWCRAKHPQRKYFRAYANHHNLRCDNKRKKLIKAGHGMHNIVEIVTDNMTEDAALLLEERLIQEYRIIEEGGSYTTTEHVASNQAAGRRYDIKMIYKTYAIYTLQVTI